MRSNSTDHPVQLSRLSDDNTRHLEQNLDDAQRMADLYEVRCRIFRHRTHLIGSQADLRKTEGELKASEERERVLREEKSDLQSTVKSLHESIEELKRTHERETADLVSDFEGRIEALSKEFETYRLDSEQRAVETADLVCERASEPSYRSF